MRTALDQLQEWLTNPEGTRLEVKEAKALYQAELLQQCVPQVNEGGNKVVSDCKPVHPAASQPGRVALRLESCLLFIDWARWTNCDRHGASVNCEGKHE